jgi:hypothetical protein
MPMLPLLPTATALAKGPKPWTRPGRNLSVPGYIIRPLVAKMHSPCHMCLDETRTYFIIHCAIGAYGMQLAIGRVLDFIKHNMACWLLA